MKQKQDFDDEDNYDDDYFFDDDNSDFERATNLTSEQATLRQSDPSSFP